MKKIIKKFINENSTNDFDKLINSEEFNKWFRNSEMILKNKPIIFYHGTKNQFDKFEEKMIGSQLMLVGLVMDFIFIQTFMKHNNMVK